MAVNTISKVAGVTLSGSTNNQVATVTGGNSLTGESNLTFDGSTLTVTGDISQSGNYTNTALPAFMVGRNTVLSNVTGDGTVYTIPYDSERFDQGNDFSSTSFTAPVTGKYQLNLTITCTDLNTPNAHTDAAGYIKTSNLTYVVNWSWGSTVAYTFYAMTLSVLADMDAADTAEAQIWASGSNKDVDISAGVGYNNFSGYLVC